MSQKYQLHLIFANKEEIRLELESPTTLYGYSVLYFNGSIFVYDDWQSDEVSVYREAQIFEINQEENKLVEVEHAIQVTSADIPKAEEENKK